MRGWVTIVPICVVAAPLLIGSVEPAHAQTCERVDFETAVEGAAKALRDLNARNKPSFQDKLRELKEKRGWSNEQFLKEAAVYVQDGTIASLDIRAGDLLSQINGMSAAGSASSAPDCKLLEEVRGAMKELVATQVEKWRHMFEKLEKALKS